MARAFSVNTLKSKCVCVCVAFVLPIFKHTYVFGRMLFGV